MRVKAECAGTGLFACLLAVPLLVVPGPGLEEHASGAWLQTEVERDLDQIKQDTLRVLVLADPLTWEQRPGALTGLEWELLERFARRRHLPIAAIPIAHQDSMVAMLRDGRGDIIAAQLTPDGWAKPHVHFTRRYRYVARCDAYAKDMEGRTFSQHADDTLHVSSWSPFLDVDGKLAADSTGPVVKILDLLPEELLTTTALGTVRHILVSDAAASLEAKRLPLVHFGPRRGKSVPLVFGVRTNVPLLQHALDHWLASSRETGAREALFTAYDNGLETRDPARRLRILTAGTDSISSFDSLFQVHADSLAWDWKLLAAVAFKESRFDTGAVSYKGAGGLMQLMPTTAAMMGVTDSGGVDGHIQGAVRYLDRLDQIWMRDITSPTQRLKFVLASYNAGPGHVKDAQRLAVELGLDPGRWDDNVERTIVLLNRPRFFTKLAARNGYCRGQDTYWYVRDVIHLYRWLSGHET